MNEVPTPGLDRRTLLRRSVAAGGIVAAGPIISTFHLPAAAASEGEEPPPPPPTPVVIHFDDVDTTGGEVQLATYAGFSWTKVYAFAPGNPPAYGYSYSSTPNIGFIGFPQDNQPAVVVSLVGDVSFTSVFITNPTGSGTDPDGPITVTIEGFDDGGLVGTQQVVLADGASATVALSFNSVDELRMSANGKYFGFDDLTYVPAL